MSEAYTFPSKEVSDALQDVAVIQALRDENARLREALQDIHDSIGNGALNVEWIKRFAQAALTPQAGKGGGE